MSVPGPGADETGPALRVADAFRIARDQHPHRAFLMIPDGCPGGPLELSYAQAATAIDARARCYREAGIGPGHHVALMLDSRADFYLHWIALNEVGATLVPIGADLVEDEVRSILRHGDVDLVLCLPERLAQVRAAAAGLDSQSQAAVAVVDEPLPRLRPAADAGRASGAAAIVFTSGSTGRPKGCLLSNEYFLSFGRWYRDLGGRCALRPGCERFITPLPPHHVNALAFSSMGAILTGGCIVQLDRFRSDRWWLLVRETHATVMHYLGVMPGMLLKRPPGPSDREHQLRFGIGGGVRHADHEVFETRFAVPLIEAWAMTETGGTGTLCTNRGPRHVGTGCIGTPSPAFAQARIADESGRPVPPQVVGELQLRAPGADPRRGFFSGYYRDRHASEAAWEGGWLHTGDLARTDEEGAFFFVGRRKQIIRRSGENISAAEVEAVLSGLAGVRQAAVVPVPDPVREEEVFACVVMEDGLEASEPAAIGLLREAAAHLSYFKLPGYLAFVASMPTTSTQKLRYGMLIEMATSMIQRADPLLFDLRSLKGELRTSSSTGHHPGRS